MVAGEVRGTSVGGGSGHSCGRLRAEAEGSGANETVRALDVRMLGSRSLSSHKRDSVNFQAGQSSPPSPAGLGSEQRPGRRLVSASAQLWEMFEREGPMV